jgi:hypothetical membrane protein
MKNIGKNISDFIFPALLIISGLLILFYSLFGGQNGFWILGGLLILSVGLFSVGMKLGMLSSAVQRGLFFVFLPLAQYRPLLNLMLRRKSVMLKLKPN